MKRAFLCSGVFHVTHAEDKPCTNMTGGALMTAPDRETALRLFETQIMPAMAHEFGVDLTMVMAAATEMPAEAIKIILDAVSPPVARKVTSPSCN